ncbi:hypothetical protein FANTH_13641 [Fusarium anthophilum]|uniref:Fumarylacetoacetase-like C-terminal domain-containing protein n=1 Tax=Fusarium anthophilum TaxID=48485 RepID=A0A8H4YN92_9HYPO|nr:hypothetical protein FANTH_13641 [Fusarium anthophilum]
MKVAFKRLLRFKSPDGRILYGEAPAGDIYPRASLVVPVYEGINPWDLKVTEATAEVAEVLCPLAYTPIIYGIGLNYKTHIAEAKWPTPPYPTVFMKPPGALNGPLSYITVDPQCRQIDYEGELVVIIGKDCKNASSPAEALDAVLGYTVGNDVSSRDWQVPEVSGNQHGYAKSFDGFAPIGPLIVSTDLVPDIGKLRLQTLVNGEVRQSAQLDDLLFGVAEIIMHLSRATTLKAGTAIMTGTPGGVAAFMKPQAWLKNGDVVEVVITEIGTIRNTFSV